MTCPAATPNCRGFTLVTTWTRKVKGTRLSTYRKEGCKCRK